MHQLVFFVHIYGWLKVAFGIFCLGKTCGGIFCLAASCTFYSVKRNINYAIDFTALIDRSGTLNYTAMRRTCDLISMGGEYLVVWSFCLHGSH